jgi:hypothetical protein
LDIGFNIIEKTNPKIFQEKLSIIEFLRKIRKEEKLPFNFAVIGLDALLYYAEDREKISKYIRDMLQDHANFLTTGNYIIQIIIEGTLRVVESSERPRVQYKEEEFLLYPIFGRVKQIDLKHFLAPLNLLS